VMVVLQELPQFQLASGLILAIFCICLQYFHRPFKEPSLDVLDSAALVSMALYMIGGLIYTSDGLLSSYIEATTLFILLSTIVFIIWAILLWAYFISITRYGWINQELIRDYTVGAWIKATAALRLNLTSDQDFYQLIGGAGQLSVPAARLAETASAVGLDQALGSDGIGHLLFLLLDRDHSGSVPSDQALENLFHGFDLQSPHDIVALNVEVNKRYFRGAFPLHMDIKAASTSSDAQFVTDAPGSHAGSFVGRLTGRLKEEWLDEMYRREKHVEDKGCPLNMLLSEQKLNRWLKELREEQDIAMIMMVSLANQWLSAFFDQSADFGLNSYTEENQFYQDMGFGCPFLIDMVLTASEDEHERCKLDIAQWFSTHQRQRKIHKDVSISGEIDYFCRPTLLYWLVNHSDAAQRKIMLKILLNVIAHDTASAASRGLPSAKVAPVSDTVLAIGPVDP